MARLPWTSDYHSKPSLTPYVRGSPRSRDAAAGAGLVSETRGGRKHGSAIDDMPLAWRKELGPGIGVQSDDDRKRRYAHAQVVAFCGDDLQVFDAATRQKVAMMQPDQTLVTAHEHAFSIEQHAAYCLLSTGAVAVFSCKHGDPLRRVGEIPNPAPARGDGSGSSLALSSRSTLSPSLARPTTILASPVDAT